MAAEPRVVVVGGVAAGMSAASRAKRRRPGAHVVVFERGAQISYGACGLPYNLADPSASIDDLVVLTPQDARDKRGIDLRLRSEVIGIDIDSGRVVARNSETGRETREPFDALILATGARPIRPSLPGMDLPGVQVLRNLEDGRRIKALLAARPRKAVIVGGGYIGVEMAHTLADRGLGVTVLEKLPEILPGWEAETIARVREELDRNGVEARTDTELLGVEADARGNLAAVATSGGSIPTDFVLVAIGVRPNSELAGETGLDLGSFGEIRTDDHQQTSHPAVWAAGDCTSAVDRLTGNLAWVPLGTTANKQGRVAGTNAVGGNARFTGIVATSGFKVFDLEVARAGLTFDRARKEALDPVSVVIRHPSRAHSYPGGSSIQVKLVADRLSTRLLGGELVGREGAAMRVNVLATALAGEMSVAELQNLDLVYAPPFAPIWDPLLVAANQLAKKVASCSTPSELYR